jgi:hypothetical protein
MAQTLARLKSSVLDNTIVPVVLESIRLFPDGLVIASGVYALFTLSYPFAVMFGTLVEATLLFQVIRGAASYLVGGGLPSPSSVTGACRTGFSSADLSTLSMFGSSLRSNFPSAPLYILSVVSAYVFSSLNAQSAELKALGSAYSSRYYISLVMLSVLLLLFMISRVYNGCDSFGVVIATVPIGLVLGVLFLEQNRRLFGRNSVNLLGIPLLADTGVVGTCATTKKP